MEHRDDLQQFSLDLADDVWRIALKRYESMATPPKSSQGRGRFDDPSKGVRDTSDEYGVLYCALTPTATFLEVLAGFRNKIGVVNDLISGELLSTDERDEAVSQKRSSGVIPGDWMAAVNLANGKVVGNAPVFDLVNPSAIQALRAEHEVSLVAMGLHDLDFSHVLSNNRTLTGAISRWLWTLKNDSEEPLFSGIRYRSRFDPESICIALYQDRYTVDGDIDVQPVTSSSPGLVEAASILRLTIS